MTAGRWLVSLRTTPGAGCRLLCMPHAGAGVAAFHALTGWLPASIDVVALRLPGRESRTAEPTVSSVDAVIQAVLEELLPGAGAPIGLLGACSGAVLAYELARGMRRMAMAAPRVMFVLAQSAPDSPIDSSQGPADSIEWARGLGGTSRSLLDDSEVAALVSRTLDADLAMMRSYAYAPQAPLDVPIIGVIGGEDALAGLSSMSGWGPHTTAGFQLREIAAGHFALADNPLAVAEIVAEALGPCA